MVLTQQQQQQHMPTVGGQRTRTSNYTTRETIDLMYVILERLPTSIGSDQWNEVLVATHAQNYYPHVNRDVEVFNSSYKNYPSW